jgi:Uma2 family endonuclease
MNASTVNHSRIAQNAYFALRTRLQGSGYEVLGPNVGVVTRGNAVRYPDALISGGGTRGLERIVTDVIVVFEVVSPSSFRHDHMTKLRECAEVPSIRRYVILDNEGQDLTVYWRAAPDQDWTASAVTAGEVLPIPEAGIEVPVDELYRGISLDEAPA